MHSFCLLSVRGELKYLVKTVNVASITQVKYNLPFTLDH